MGKRKFNLLKASIDLSIFLVIILTVNAQSENLLRNGNFEEWEIRNDTYQTLFGAPLQFPQTDTVLMPKNWFAEIVFSCCVFPELGNVVFQTNESNTGSFGLKLGGFFGLHLQTGIYLFQNINVVPGFPYVMSYHVKNPFGYAGNARRMRGTWLDVNGNPISSAFFLLAPSSINYIHVHGSTIFAPCNATSIKIYFDKADFGGITYDDGYFGQNLSANPNACPITIDIKPGSFPNAINLKSKGIIPVGVLSTSTFNAPELLNLSTFTFENATIVKHSVEDVNNDSLKDLVMFFKTQDTTITCIQTSAALQGKRFDNGIVIGTDSIVTVGC